jgi:hypothetical protein
MNVGGSRIKRCIAPVISGHGLNQLGYLAVESQSACGDNLTGLVVGTKPIVDGGLVFGADNVDLQVVPRSREPEVLVSHIPGKIELVRGAARNIRSDSCAVVAAPGTVRIGDRILQKSA